MEEKANTSSFSEAERKRVANKAAGCADPPVGRGVSARVLGARCWVPGAECHAASAFTSTEGPKADEMQGNPPCFEAPLAIEEVLSR